jgi:hypothetical protein
MEPGYHFSAYFYKQDLLRRWFREFGDVATWFVLESRIIKVRSYDVTRFIVKQKYANEKHIRIAPFVLTAPAGLPVYSIFIGESMFGSVGVSYELEQSRDQAVK